MENRENKKLLLEELKNNDRVAYVFLVGLDKAILLRDLPKDCLGYIELDKDKLYALFLRLIDSKTSKRLKKLDKEIESLEVNLCLQTGFIPSREGAVKYDNFINQNDPEFATHDTYKISRDNDGFYVDDSEKNFNSYYRGVYNVSCDALRKNYSTFEALHNLYSEKEAILGGKYTLSQHCASNNLPRLIANELGYGIETHSYKR